MNLVFWNVNKKNINSEIKLLAIEQSVDLLALAEYRDDKNELLKMLQSAGEEYYFVPQIACKKISIFSKIKPGKFIPIRDQTRYTIKRIPHENYGKITVVIVHCPSKLHSSDDDRNEVIRDLKDAIETTEKENNCNKTIIMGDFNMNPFEAGMVSASFLHAFPIKEVAGKNKRVVNSKEYTTFYNPMWKFFGGDFGTYYYSKATQYNLYWNIFDQFVVRPSLMNDLHDNSIKIINSISGQSILGKAADKDVSDHLPIFLCL